MTSAIDVCNKALSEIGARATITSFLEASPAAVQCRLQYDSLRQQLLRAAPWGFARKTATLTTLGLQTDTPPTAPWPFYVKYLYPADCTKMRYILPPPDATYQGIEPPAVGVNVGMAWGAPSRSWRFLVSVDDTVVPSRRVVVANIASAVAVYTKDETNPDMFDPLFENALVMALANKLCMPLSGNVALKQGFAQLAENAIMQARAVDGNETISTSNHTVDWIATRSAGDVSGYGNEASGWGTWYSGFDNMSWGM